MSNKLPSKTFCVLPWMHVATASSGSYRLCCNSNPKTNQIRNPESGKAYKIYRESVADIWNEPQYVEYRRQFLNGEMPDTCERCYREEAAGIRSPRIGYNEKWFKEDIDLSLEPETPDVRYVDLRLGNLCNLKCRMCNPYASSMWVKDWNEVLEGVDLQEHDNNHVMDDERLEMLANMTEWPDRAKTGVNFVDIAPTIREIYLTGGEPTLAKSQYKLFDYCIENNLAKKIKLKYNTNLTNIPPKMLEYWKHFKGVQLNASIDAVGELDRYIRYPSNWDRVQENFFRLATIDSVNIQVHCTFQALNATRLAELIGWMDEQGFGPDGDLYINILNHPSYLNVRALPQELKQLAEDRLQPWLHWQKVKDAIAYMWAEDWHEKEWDRFTQYNKNADIQQKMNLLDIVPEFKGYVDE